LIVLANLTEVHREEWGKPLKGQHPGITWKKFQEVSRSEVGRKGKGARHPEKIKRKIDGKSL